MKRFTIFCWICFILSACSESNEKKSTNLPSRPEQATLTDSLPFPQSWLGDWEGTLKIFKDNKVVQNVPMELELAQMDSSANFTWAIIYGEDKETGRRPYELELIDTDKGQYRIDEKNSILLESYLYGNKLLCWYEVMGSQILSIYEKRGDKIIFEIIFGSSEPVSITGDQKYQGEDIPAVSTFPIGGYQRAVLTKVK